MKILEYIDLKFGNLKKKYDKLKIMLEQGDFYSAEVKKLKGTPYYRAKLDNTHRLLFKPIKQKEQFAILILELIENHDYDKSRFLSGATIDEDKVPAIIDLQQDPTIETLPYLNRSSSKVHILDKSISFDDEQEDIYQLELPTIIIGSAGSGKTMLMLEKLKRCVGDVLYVTHSAYLAKNTRQLYFSQQYQNEDQDVSFLSYAELIEMQQIPASKPVNINDFTSWLRQAHHSKIAKDYHRLFEEIKGVLTGTHILKPYISREEYMALGIKQSIYSQQERGEVYDLFEKYLIWLKNNNLHDLNILSHNYLANCKAKFDAIFIDEVQDFTLIQTHYVLSQLIPGDQFLLCGDSNQIVHPNFFSWSNIKSYFHNHQQTTKDITRILQRNYRNSHQVTEISNRLLKLKNARFGSIDKESHYLIESTASNQGVVQLFKSDSSIINSINKTSKLSSETAIVVMNEQMKVHAQKLFDSPLIFNIQEAKGLEYDNIILFHFTTSADSYYKEICRDIDANDLISSDFSYGRCKDKSDKSLEVYKFFINALYVALTRSVKNIYWLEENQDHKIFKLLGIKTSNVKDLDYRGKASSLEEWNTEAIKLEQQGKTEQANQIRKSILKQTDVPWVVFSLDKLDEHKDNANQISGKLAKESKILLLEYAIVYNKPEIIKFLQDIGMSAAFKLTKSKNTLEAKYYGHYSIKKPTQVFSHVKNYGVNFRNPLNQTPLMIATLLGRGDIIDELLKQGAKLDLTDNHCKTAFMIAMEQAFICDKYQSKYFAAIYKKLLPDVVDIKYDNKLIKINSHLMEFYLLNLIMSILGTYKTNEENHEYFKIQVKSISFSAVILQEMLANTPEQIIPIKRKRRQYISSILSKNEVSRDDKYNRKLFLRIKTGFYVLNPDLEIRTPDGWKSIYLALGYSHLDPSQINLNDRGWNVNKQGVVQNIICKEYEELS